jgi:molybdopterin converting factor small subunit
VKISFRYLAQARQEAGVDTESVEMADGASLQAAVDAAAARHTAKFRSLVLDDSGTLRRSLLVMVNGAPARANAALTADDEITILPPIAGG